jgi:hypothetical protein
VETQQFDCIGLFARRERGTAVLLLEFHQSDHVRGREGGEPWLLVDRERIDRATAGDRFGADVATVGPTADGSPWIEIKVARSAPAYEELSVGAAKPKVSIQFVQ